MTETAKPSGGTSSWLGVLLLPLIIPLLFAVELGRAIFRPVRPRERWVAVAILVASVAWVVCLSWLPDAATPWLLGGAVAFLAAVSFIARRASGHR